MGDREQFIRAILEAPDDDAPRLVFADWLEDHGADHGADHEREPGWVGSLRRPGRLGLYLLRWPCQLRATVRWLGDDGSSIVFDYDRDGEWKCEGRARSHGDYLYRVNGRWLCEVCVERIEVRAPLYAEAR